MKLADVQKLADELIELRCERHSVGNLYEYLLKAYGDANRAKADFIRFLSGELPPRLVRAASAWIAEEQGGHMDPGDAQRPRSLARPGRGQCGFRGRSSVKQSQSETTNYL